MSNGNTVIVRKNRFPEIARELDIQLSMIVRKAVFKIEGDVKNQIRANGQIKTGNMLNSVQGQMSGPTSGEVVAHADYSIYQNYGTRYMSGRPFMEPAAALNKPVLLAAVTGVLRGLR